MWNGFLCGMTCVGWISMQDWSEQFWISSLLYPTPGVWRLQMEFEDCNLCSNALIHSGDKQVDYQPLTLYCNTLLKWMPRESWLEHWWSECLGKSGWSIELRLELWIAWGPWLWDQLMWIAVLIAMCTLTVWQEPEILSWEATREDLDLWTFG